MRRSRIKAVAMLPARRKQTIKDEPPSAVPDETPDAETPTIPTESTKQSETETPTSPPVKTSIDSKLQETSERSQKDSPISERNTKETSEENLEPSETITKHSNRENIPKDSEKLKNSVINSPEKRVEEVTVTRSLEEPKTSPCNDSLPITKISQTRASFMRPIPRLDGGGRIRRNSIQGSGASASESEDDTRRTSAIGNRMRNDSSSSIQSPKGASRENSNAASGANLAINNVISLGATTGGQNFTTPGSRQKRKVVVSESARKLAEARREFLLKHENKQPDRAKLTMYDLIYYNPVTNPMKKNDPNSTTQRTSSSVVRPETEDEEEEDETSEAMPVPQVKVGPDGHLVIDEQSLVIEHTGAKKNRQALARTEALVDEESGGSGFYKKRAKSKDWPKWETLKFYKALNGVGTDFLLMQSLFPKRSRQELKMKFKKEEKMNRTLVEKALAYHQEFDIDSLKEDLATFEETENKQFELAKSNKSTPSPGGGVKRKRKKSRRMVALSIGEENEEIEEAESHEPVQKSERKKSVQRRNTVAETTRTRSESTSTSCDSASDTEIYHVKPTRSGRLPKVRKLQAPMIDNDENVSSDNEQEIEEISSSRLTVLETDRSSLNSNEEPDESTVNCINIESVLDKSSYIKDSIPDMSKVEPGSLVIVSRESNDESGDSVLQVYMVSSDLDENSDRRQHMTPIVLTPDLLNTVAAGITEITPINIKME